MSVSVETCVQESSGCLQPEKPQATGQCMHQQLEGHRCICICEGSKCHELKRTKCGYFSSVNLIPCVPQDQSQQGASELQVQA